VRDLKQFTRVKCLLPISGRDLPPISSIICKGASLMNALRSNILKCIGNTPLVALRNVVPSNGVRILLKLESENPTGSIKDRQALAMIEAPKADGRLAPAGAVVEYTGAAPVCRWH
jgi:hypothetical protein